VARGGRICAAGRFSNLRPFHYFWTSLGLWQRGNRNHGHTSHARRNRAGNRVVVMPCRPPLMACRTAATLVFHPAHYSSNYPCLDCTSWWLAYAWKRLLDQVHAAYTQETSRSK